MAFRKKRPLRRKVKRARKPRSSVTLAVKRYVKRSIHSQIENKSVQINASTAFGNYLQSNVMNAYPMCPLSGYWSISQGIGQGARIGNQIKTRKCYLSYVLRANQYDATNNPAPLPCQIMLMLGLVKNTPSFAPAAVDFGQLFQNGSGVAAPVGTLRDLVSVINRDYWIIKKRWFHKIGYSTSEGTGNQPANHFFANNDFKLNEVRKLDITKFVPATYQFNDGGISPTSRNLFFMYEAVAASGEQLPSTRVPISIDYWIDYHYEDA